jgi:hypothetical protein
MRRSGLRFKLGGRAIEQDVAVRCGGADDALVPQPARGRAFGGRVGVFELGLGVRVVVVYAIDVDEDVDPRTVVAGNDNLMADGNGRDRRCTGVGDDVNVRRVQQRGAIG